MQELWKPVKGWEHLYEVSNLGRVRSKDRYTNYKNSTIFKALHKGKILKNNLKNTGYYEVLLSDGKKHQYARVHKLVANAFIENPNGYSVLNHKNEDKTNNRVENLEWCTTRYNVLYSIENKTTIYQYDCNGILLGIWNSYSQIIDRFGGDKTGYGHCCHGDLKTYLGYVWSFNELSKEEAISRFTNNNLCRIAKYSLGGVLLKTYASIKEASEDANYGGSFISMCCSGKRKAKDFIWKKV